MWKKPGSRGGPGKDVVGEGTHQPGRSWISGEANNTGDRKREKPEQLVNCKVEP